MSQLKTPTLSKRRTLKGGRELQDGRHVYWWLELLMIFAFYEIYSFVRNANEGGTAQAFHNAKRLIGWERAIGIYHEELLQDWAQHFKPLIIAANYFYGSLHFVVTIGCGILLYRKFTNDYPRFRNMLGITTALALIGFTRFPLMPPRLLPATYGFVDTLARYPTFWSFNSGAVSKISNQFAAMPSVHVAWATWCTLVLYSRVQHRWAKVLAVLYPIGTVTVIVITANHYILDAVGGLVALGAGWILSGIFTRAGRKPRVADTTAPLAA